MNNSSGHNGPVGDSAYPDDSRLFYAWHRWPDGLDNGLYLTDEWHRAVGDPVAKWPVLPPPVDDWRYVEPEEWEERTDSLRPLILAAVEDGRPPEDVVAAEYIAFLAAEVMAGAPAGIRLARIVSWAGRALAEYADRVAEESLAELDELERRGVEAFRNTLRYDLGERGGRA
jgi:hypothetical protein